MTQREDPRHNLRFTHDLKARLRHAAIDNGRSLNAEILDRLERSFAPDPASQLVEALRPVARLNDEDRQELGRLLAGIGAILSK